MKDEHIDDMESLFEKFEQSSKDLDDFLDWLKSEGDTAMSGFNAETILICRILSRIATKFPMLLLGQDDVFDLTALCYVAGYRRCEQDKSLNDILKGNSIDAKEET